MGVEVSATKAVAIDDRHGNGVDYGASSRPADNGNEAVSGPLPHQRPHPRRCRPVGLGSVRVRQPPRLHTVSLAVGKTIKGCHQQGMPFAAD
jgi:hypothetical protein